MDSILIVAIVLLGFEAVFNARELAIVYRLRKNKAKFLEAHSQIGEGSELVVFLLAGVLLYLSDVNLVLVVIVLTLGIYHLPPTVQNKSKMSKMSDEAIKKLSLLVMSMCAIEVIFSVYTVIAIIPLL